MFLRDEHGLDSGGGSTVPLAVAVDVPRHKLRRSLAEIELVPDLGSRIGSLQWYRGAATCIGLCAVTLLLAPGFENPIYGYVPAPLTGAEREAARVQAIQPLREGSATGYHMAATDMVAPLTDTPERPIINLSPTLHSGSSLQALLQRSGVGKDEARTVFELVGNTIELSDLKGATTLDLTLGRRVDKSQPRPLEALELRARFDLKVRVVREGGALAIKEIPIAVDHTPLRIRGRVGSSLYRSAREAGVPAKAVEAYIRTIATRIPISKLGSDDKFDIIVERARAETGEVQMGSLLYAGVDTGSTKLALVRWDEGGRTDWYDTSGKGEKKGAMSAPVSGRVTSSYGMRRHPVLGRSRMHKGIDFGAPYGSPIYAATDGVVQLAGRNGGYGNFVKIKHAGCYATGYGHMSKIAVRSGTRVRRGQVIGYVGSTGMSTGPHLHYELYCNGRAVNPSSVSFSTQRQLVGGDLSEFRAKLGRLRAVPVSSPSDDEGDE